MNTDFTYRDKVRVGILGSDTVLGKSYSAAFGDHPWFELGPNPDSNEFADCQLICSAREDSKSTEELLASQGQPVIICRNENLTKNIPLIMPEVDIGCLRLINSQNWDKKGAIIALPSNESALAALMIKAIASKINVEKIIVRVPFKGEDDANQIKSEISVLLEGIVPSALNSLTIEEAMVQASGLVTANVEITTISKITENEIVQVIEEYRGVPQELKLPKAMDEPMTFHPNLIQIQDLYVVDHLVKMTLASQDSVELKTYMALMTAEILVKYGYVFW